MSASRMTKGVGNVEASPGRGASTRHRQKRKLKEGKRGCGEHKRQDRYIRTVVSEIRGWQAEIVTSCRVTTPTEASLDPATTARWRPSAGARTPQSRRPRPPRRRNTTAAAAAPAPRPRRAVEGGAAAAEAQAGGKGRGSDSWMWPGCGFVPPAQGKKNLARVSLFVSDSAWVFCDFFFFLITRSTESEGGRGNLRGCLRYPGEKDKHCSIFVCTGE